MMSAQDCVYGREVPEPKDEEEAAKALALIRDRAITERLRGDTERAARQASFDKRQKERSEERRIRDLGKINGRHECDRHERNYL